VTDSQPDPITVLRVVTQDAPGLETYFLCRWSLAARLVCDSAADPASEVEDLGPRALMLAQAAQRGDFKTGEMVMVGIASGGKWVKWMPGRLAPIEPVPGSPGEAAARSLGSALVMPSGSCRP
jgi:hypothetical protein